MRDRAGGEQAGRGASRAEQSKAHRRLAAGQMPLSLSPSVSVLSRVVSGLVWVVAGRPLVLRWGGERARRRMRVRM